MLACCDGDLKLYNVGIGSDCDIVNGQPVLDEGLENAVYMSLFSSPGWWGNALIDESEQHISTLENIIDEQPLTNETRLNIEEAARNALAWMISDGIAQNIEVSATIPAIGRADLVIEIFQPERVEFKYNLNWSAMRRRVGA